MTVRVRVLGCGNSNGVPAAGGHWGDCDPNEPRNRRSRASIFIDDGKTNVVVDTSPDFREQLNRIAPVSHIDGVIYTHAHSDHIHGLDDLRMIWKLMRKEVDIYGNQATVDELVHRFPYVFRGSLEGLYPPTLKSHVVKDRLKIGKLDFRFFTQDHGTCETLGIRIGDFAYSADMVNLGEDALETLEGINVWVVDGGGHWNEKNPVHASIHQVKRWVERLKPEMTYLTVLSRGMDYKTLCNELPQNIKPAYDGLEISVQQ